MKKLSEVEKLMLSNASPDYVFYYCSTHGVFQLRKDVNNGVCPYSGCNGAVSVIMDVCTFVNEFKPIDK